MKPHSSARLFASTVEVLLQPHSSARLEATTVEAIVRAYEIDHRGAWGAAIGLSATPIPLDEVDYKGVFFEIGGGDSGWSNPHTSGEIVISRSSVGAGSDAEVVDRTSSNVHTNSVPNSWFKIDLGANRKVAASHLAIRQRSTYNANYHRYLLVEGSDNDTDWTVLADVNNTLTLSQNAWNTVLLAGSSSFRYFRITMDGTDSSGGDYFCLGEIELFGLLFDN